MRKLFFVAGLLIGSISPAGAASLQKCPTSGDPHKAIQCLVDNISILNKELMALQSQTPKLDSIVIEWAGHTGSCITYLGNNLVQIVDTCTDPNRNKFIIRSFQ